MKVVVFGSGGFIGNQLSAHLESDGFDIVRCARTSASIGEVPKVKTYPWCLQRPLDGLSEAFCPDAAILMAHDFAGQEGATATLSGYKQILDWLALQQCKRIIFVSSYSAGPHATSLYGRTKYTVEKLVENTRNGVVVRPGLVAGGGIEKKLISLAARYRFLPVPGLKDPKVPVIRINTLCIALTRLLLSEEEKRLYYFHEEPLDGLRSHLRGQCHKVGIRVLLIPTPLIFVRLGFWLAKHLNLKLPVNEDNLRGLEANQKINRGSDLQLMTGFASHAP